MESNIFKRGKSFVVEVNGEEVAKTMSLAAAAKARDKVVKKAREEGH